MLNKNMELKVTIALLNSPIENLWVKDARCSNELDYIEQTS
jgi:hypothetical protein